MLVKWISFGTLHCPFWGWDLLHRLQGPMWDSLFINYSDFSKQWTVTVWLPRLPNNWWQTRRQSKNIHRQQLYPLIHNPGPCSPFFTWKRTLVQNAKFIPSLKIFLKKKLSGAVTHATAQLEATLRFQGVYPLSQGLPTARKWLQEQEIHDPTQQ